MKKNIEPAVPTKIPEVKTKKTLHEFFSFLPPEDRDNFFKSLGGLNYIAQEMFKHNPDAPNYLEVYFEHPETKEPFGSFTFSKSTATTPHELRKRAEAKLKAIRNFINNFIGDSDIPTVIKEDKC